jgi:hypothetical protein
MSMFSRFFGKRNDDDLSVGQLVANPKSEPLIGLDVLFANKPKLNSQNLSSAMRTFHSSMRSAKAEIDPALAAEGKFLGLVGWGKHVIRLVGFDLPMPKDATEACIAPAHYPQDLKQRAREHQAHLLLYYAGSEDSILEQYVALAAFSGVLARLGAIVVLNEAAHTSFPADALTGDRVDGDIIELLRTLPLLILYCGFVKCEVERVPGVWMRTYGCHLFGLPDFAAHAPGHDHGQRFFDTFENVLAYLRNSGSKLASGHTAQVGPNDYLRFRAPTADERFLDSEREIFVAEIISADDVATE